jgi:hypothetical protein
MAWTVGNPEITDSQALLSQALLTNWNKYSQAKEQNANSLELVLNTNNYNEDWTIYSE